MEDEVRRFRQKKLDELRRVQAHKDDSPAAKEVWRKAVADIKDIDAALRGGANTLAGIKTATSHNASLVSEINKELGIAEEVVVAKEAVVAEKAVVEPEQTSDGGVFSARLEALISAALQDGVLTDKERELLKRRVEKEGEDWDEVEMIVEARLAEMNPVASTPSSRTSENNNVSQDTTLQDNKNTTPQDVSSKADNEYPEDYLKKMKITAILPFIKRKLPFIEPVKLSSRSKIDAYDYLAELSEYVPDIELSVASFISCAEFYETMGFFDNPEAKIRAFLQISEEQLKKPETIQEYKKNKLDALRNAQSHKNDSEQAKQIWRKAVSEIKMIDAIIRDGVKSVDELKLKLQKEQMKLQMEEQAKEKEQMKLQTILDYSEAERYSNERNVDIPEGYIELGEECFQDRHLQSICLPSTLEKINDNAFERCNKMKKVDFSKCTSLIEIGDMVFHACTKLEEIVLPDSVTTIGDGAFSYCTKLRKIVMPSSLEKLGDSVFEDCDSLEEVDMSKVTKLTTIPKRFETGDDKQMVIPMGVTTIRKDAFEYCNKYALFLPPTLRDYMDKNGNWESVYLFASPLEKMDNILENCNNLYVLPQYLEVYKSIHEALGSWCEIHTMPDEFMFFYDN